MLDAQAVAQELLQALAGQADVHPVVETPGVRAVGADLGHDHVERTARLVAALFERDPAWLDAHRQAILRKACFDPVLEMKDGRAVIPDGPGWGVRIKADWLAAAERRASQG